jgi:hypothetical protein
MTATSGDPQARDLHRCLAREHALGRRGREPGADLPPGSESGSAQGWLALSSARNNRPVGCRLGRELYLGQQRRGRVVRIRGASKGDARGNTGCNAERGQKRAPAERARPILPGLVIRLRKHRISPFDCCHNRAASWNVQNSACLFDAVTRRKVRSDRWIHKIAAKPPAFKDTSWDSLPYALHYVFKSITYIVAGRSAERRARRVPEVISQRKFGLASMASL